MTDNIQNEQEKPTTLTCPHCTHTMLHGARVCAGCGAEIKYDQPHPIVTVVLGPVILTIWFGVGFYMHSFWWGLGIAMISLMIIMGIGSLILPSLFKLNRITFERNKKK